MVKKSNGDSLNFPSLSRELETQCHFWSWKSCYCAWPLSLRSWSGSTTFRQRLSIFQPKTHRYWHQDYLSSMFLTIKTKNNENSAMWPCYFVPSVGGLHTPPNDACVNMCWRYVGSAIWRRFVKTKSGEKLKEKIQGSYNSPLKCRMVKILKSWDFPNIWIEDIPHYYEF